MNYILDSSVAVKWVLVELYSDKANLLRDDYRNAIHELFLRKCSPSKSCTLSRRPKGKNASPRTKGGILWADVMGTCPKLDAYLPPIPRANEIDLPCSISNPAPAVAGRPASPRGAASGLKNLDEVLSQSVSGCVQRLDGATGSSFPQLRRQTL